jgi:hypothetical protein
MRLKSFSLILFLWCALTSAQSQPGTLISVEGPVRMAKETIYDTLLAAAGDISTELIQKVLHPNYDVDAYKIIYSTLDLQGNATNASGALFIPRNPEAAKPMVAYLHGTLTCDRDAPSYLTGTETAIGWMFAMNGYITILPDYLGMGEGGGPHPYLHKQTEASATMDMIKAAKTFFQQEDILFINDLYLCGYSQGGHAAVATQQFIESQPAPDVNLRINVAGSGPYSLSYIQKKFTFANETYENACFLPYLLSGYQAAYGNLYQNLSQAYVPPYDSQIPSLFDGTLTVGEIDSHLPLTWKTMFQPAYLDEIANNYFHPANRALRANDLVHWKPKTILRLYYTTADELVDKDNSIVAWLMFVLQGATNVYAMPVGSYKHAEAATYVIFLAKSNFDCLSGVNPCPIDTKSTINLKSSGTDNQTLQFLQLLQESDKPDPWAYLSKPQYAWLLSETEPTDSEKTLVVFPQPASGKAWIDISSLQGESLTIRCFNPTGRLVIYNKNVFANGLFELDCHNLTGGVYTIIIEGSEIYRIKLVVVK